MDFGSQEDFEAILADFAYKTWICWKIRKNAKIMLKIFQKWFFWKENTQKST